MNFQLFASISAEVIPSRSLNSLYIIFDIAFLVFFAVLLFITKRRLTLIFALCGGVLYFLVDYGIFYLILGTRTVTGASTFWFLLWLSMSYGMTNFAWIWLWIKKDKHLFEWSLLIIAWWITCPLLSQNFGSSMPLIEISRGTNQYHGVMAIFMFVSYAFLCIQNFKRSKEDKINILWLLAIGVLVQFAWEASLLITGIRAAEWGPLVINSLIETNCGIPAIFLIYLAVTKRFSEDGKRLPLQPVPNSIQTQPEYVVEDSGHSEMN